MEHTNLIVFEMPANDLMRMALRFEYLRQLTDKFITKKTEIDSIICIDIIIDMLHLLDRPELRSKYFQEFSRFSIYLERLYHTANIDQTKLHTTIEQLNQQMEKLNKYNGKFGHELRENFFIKNLIQFSDKPGSLCGYNTPEFPLWIHQTNDIRYENLKHCLNSFDEITEHNTFLLQLVRGSGKHSQQTAHDGFYQQNIDPKIPCHLIQVRLNKEFEAFPRISIGRHGISIVFLKTNFQTEPEKDHRDITFELIICAL